MAIYRLKRPAPAITSMQFSSYNKAIEFALDNPGMLPSKPYKRILWNDGVPNPVWFVTFGLARETKPGYEKIEEYA
jgi:hypothetical protein